MKKLFTSLAAMIIVAIAIIMFLGDNTKEQSSRVKMPTTTTISSTTDVTTETSVTTSTIKYSTTTTDTTSSTSTTATSTTTTATMVVATTEYIEEEIVLVKEEFVEVKEKSVKEEYIPTTEEYQQTATHTETVTIPVTEVEETYYEETTTTQNNMTINYSINQLTYYSGPSGCKGRWGRTLLNNYSIASNLLPDGAIVHIESNDGSINGDYRVDDTGGMRNNVIDIFYTSYSNVPYPFSRDGRISCTVWVYE